MDDQPEAQVTDDDIARLTTILGKPADDTGVQATLEKIAAAGAREALDYCTGKVVPTTFSEVRANRINYLLAAGIELPQLEAMAAHLLQVPDSTARRLVQVAASRFAFEWNPYFKASVKNALTSGEWVGDQYDVTVKSPLVLEWMREQIATSGQPQIKETGRGGTIELERETHTYLSNLVTDSGKDSNDAHTQ